jgi:hypothetical protein
LDTFRLKKDRVMNKTLIALAICFFACGSLLAQMDCQKAYPIPAKAMEISVETEGAVDIFKGFFKVPPISAQAKTKASMAQHDVLSKFPNADVVALRQQELSYVCELLNADKTLKTTEKASILQDVVEGTRVTPTMLQNARAYNAKQASPGGGTSIINNGNGNTFINGNGNTIQISQPPPSPYAAQTTYRVNGTKSITDNSAGTGSFDSSIEDKYYHPIIGAEARGEWNEMLRLSDMAIREAPDWFTGYYFKGRALIHLCHQKEAVEQLQAFISAAKDATQYKGLVVSAQLNIKDPSSVLRGEAGCN